MAHWQIINLNSLSKIFFLLFLLAFSVTFYSLIAQSLEYYMHYNQIKYYEIHFFTS
jgi:hypothetical protein